LKCFYPSTKLYRYQVYQQTTMSTKTMSTTTKSNQRKLCPVCKDAGKTEKEYTSHFVRDKPGPDGITICPLLLSLNCRKCGKKGHTFKYCKVNTEKKKETRPTIVQEKPKSVQKGKFESLAESSDDEEGEEKEETEEKETEEKQEQVVTKQMTYADKLKEKQLPLAPTLPDLFVLRSTIPLAPVLPDLCVLRPAPVLPDLCVLRPAPALPALLPAPVLPEQKLPKAPVLPVTEEEKEKIQKLKDGCRKIISQKCSWAESDSESEDED